jgi:hypothetical protein
MNKNCVRLTCAVILSLSAAVQAWPDSLTTQASVELLQASITNTGPCFGGKGCLSPDTATATLANLSGSGNAFASAGFGTLDATSSITASGVGNTNVKANTIASFSDSFSVLSGTGSGTFEIAFVTTGATATASGNGDDADVFLTMRVGDGTLAGTLTETYAVIDNVSFSGTETLTTIGLPTTVFTIDASDGQTIFFSADEDTQSSVSTGGGSASAADPMSVFITAPTGFTFATSSGATYSPTPSPSPVPEPSSLLLLSSGLACLGAWRCKVLKRI